MEGVHASVPMRVGKKMRKRRELDALVSGPGSRGGRLLSASSDEGEPWGRRSARRRRSRPFVKFAAALGLCVCVVSAATVLWLFVDVRRQIVSLRVEMDRVSTSSDGVNDALQVCHTAAKELRANATSLNARLAKLELDHQELVKRVEAATGELSAVSEQLAAAPKLADTPRRLAELQRTVADFGSQINGFDGALSSAKKQAVAASTGLDEVRTLLKDLESRTNDTVASVAANVKRDEDLKDALTSLNTTLVTKVDELRTRIEEINKPVSVPVPSPAPASVEPAPVTTASVTTQPPQGPPAKPIVLN